MPDIESSLSIFTKSLMFNAIRIQIFKSATTGMWNAKNNHDHIALKNNCIKNNFLVSENVLKAEIDIRIYKIGQTIPKTYPGGLRVDLLRSWYQRLLAVSEEESPPKINATKTNTNTKSHCYQPIAYFVFMHNLSDDEFYLSFIIWREAVLYY